jgi:hypothetical protein
MVISINNRNYLKLPGGEGEMISRIPPEYRPKERWFESIKTIVLFGYIIRGMILSKFQERLRPSDLRNFGEALVKFWNLPLTLQWFGRLIAGRIRVTS